MKEIDEQDDKDMKELDENDNVILVEGLSEKEKQSILEFRKKFLNDNIRLADVLSEEEKKSIQKTFRLQEENFDDWCAKVEEKLTTKKQKKLAKCALKMAATYNNRNIVLNMWNGFHVIAEQSDTNKFFKCMCGTFTELQGLFYTLAAEFPGDVKLFEKVLDDSLAEQNQRDLRLQIREYKYKTKEKYDKTLPTVAWLLEKPKTEGFDENLQQERESLKNIYINLIHISKIGSNSTQYKNLVGALKEAIDTKDPDSYLTALNGVKERAKQYLNQDKHLEKAGTYNGERRRKCAFLALHIASPVVAKKYIDSANKKRNQDHQINVESLKTEPHVGRLPDSLRKELQEKNKKEKAAVQKKKNSPKKTKTSHSKNKDIKPKSIGI